MPQLPRFKPNVWRILLGFVLAPTIPSHNVPLVLIYGPLPATIIFGIPAFVLLYRSVHPHVVPIVVTGGIVAVLPWALLQLFPVASHAEIGDCVTIENGRTTWCGFWSNMQLLSLIFVYGAFGGLVFWFCAVWRSVQLKELDSRTG
jgi:hypothetical protein